MSESTSNTKNKITSLVRAWGPKVILLGIILLSFISPWFVDRSLPKRNNIFYWPLFVEFIFWFRCLAIPLLLVFLFKELIKNKARLQIWKIILVLIVVFMLTGVLAFGQFLVTWYVNILSHVETTNFQGDVYHLARIDEYDSWGRYYLGECDTYRYWCRFHEIFHASPYTQSKIEMLGSDQYLLIRVEEDIIYRYDGFEEACYSRDLVHCHKHQP